jgi:hypothetical protein
MTPGFLLLPGMTKLLPNNEEKHLWSNSNHKMLYQKLKTQPFQHCSAKPWTNCPPIYRVMHPGH